MSIRFVNKVNNAYFCKQEYNKPMIVTGPIPAVEPSVSKNQNLEKKLSSALKEVKDSMEGKKQLLSWEELLNNSQ